RPGKRSRGPARPTSTVACYCASRARGNAAGRGRLIRAHAAELTVGRFWFPQRESCLSRSRSWACAHRSRATRTLTPAAMDRIENGAGRHYGSLGGAGMLTGNGINMDVEVEGYTRAPEEEMRVRAVLAGPEFFGTLRVPLLRGRGFTADDEPPPPRASESAHATVAIIGEGMARGFFGDADPVGKHFTVDGAQKVRLDIVGVAKDT